MDGQVFDRIEKKYLITKPEKKEILKVIKKHMTKDDYYESGVLNIYFDNDNYDLIIQSIDQPIFKHKFRARSYHGYDRVFLEIKTKLRDQEFNPGYKRRLMITHKEYEEFVEGKEPISEIISRTKKDYNSIQIAKEIDYLIKHLDLKPKILVKYDRESYKDENDLRITFDENLKYRERNIDFKTRKRDKIYFKDKRNIIMEIKAQDVFPLWLVQVLSKNKIYSQQFSKIGKIYEKLGKEKNV